MWFNHFAVIIPASEKPTAECVITYHRRCVCVCVWIITIHTGPATGISPCLQRRIDYLRNTEAHRLNSLLFRRDLNDLAENGRLHQAFFRDGPQCAAAISDETCTHFYLISPRIHNTKHRATVQIISKWSPNCTIRLNETFTSCWFSDLNGMQYEGLIPVFGRFQNTRNPTARIGAAHKSLSLAKLIRMNWLQTTRRRRQTNQPENRKYVYSLITFLQSTSTVC